MAKVIAIGQPVNESEREAVAYLRDHLPDSFTVIHNFELRQGNSVFEIDLALLGPHCVHVIDVKGTRGLVDVYGSKWYPEGRAPYHSPLALLRGHAKALKSLICDQHPTDRELRSVHVDAAVLMTAPDVHVQDPGGHDAPAVAYLKKCTTFFKSTARIPDNRSADIRHHFGKIRRAIVGRAQPRSAPPCYGSWQVEEKLGGHRPLHGVPGPTHTAWCQTWRYCPPARVSGRSVSPVSGTQARAAPDRECLPGGSIVAWSRPYPHRARFLRERG